MGQKNKLCSSNKVDVDNIVFSALQYGLRTLEDNLEHTQLRMVWRNVWRGEVIQNCLNKICLVRNLQLDRYMIENIDMKRLASYCSFHNV